MALTAANTMPVQTQQVQGARPSADILLRRGKKKKGESLASPTPANANILMRGQK